MAEWRTMPFSDAVVVNPPVHLKRGGTYPFVAMADVEPTRRSIHSLREREFRGSGARFENGDTLMARITPCLENGKIGRYQSARASRVAHGSTEFLVIRGRGGITDDEFAYYLTRSKGVRDYAISQMSGTSGRQRVPTQSLDHLYVRVPGLAQQYAIAQTLGKLDDKIELNRRMNETLESMARAVFRDWFVDFGPTRAKAEGREPYLAPDLWDLFPDSLDNEDRPLGWNVSEIGSEVDALGGATPSTKEPSYWVGGEYHWATPKDLSKLSSPVLMRTGRKITAAGVRKISSGLLPVGTVLMSSRAPIGYLAIAEAPTAVNQGFIAMVCGKRLPNLFVLFWCYENLDHIKGISGGTTFSEISKRAFRPIPVVMPPDRIIKAFERIVRPLYSRIVANVRESESLAQTRDFLLPKLMSGEIRVSEAENSVEAVA